MTEETKNADVAGSWGMIIAVIVSTITGWLFLISFFLGIHDYETTLNTPTSFPITQILLDNFGRELTIFFMCLLLVACWFCGLASVTANSRMIYAFSRDHAIVSECHLLKKRNIKMNVNYILSPRFFFHSQALDGGIQLINVYPVLSMLFGYHV